MPEIEKTQNVLTLDPETKIDQEVAKYSERLTDEKIKQALESLLAPRNVEPDDNEPELSYKEIAGVFLDAQNERVEELRQQKRALILEMFLDNPTEAFRVEFGELERLYEGRTMRKGPDMLGSISSEFCTADHEKERADYLFRHSTSKSGRERLEVTKVYDLFDKPETITVSLMDNELHVVKPVYRRGEYNNVELEGDDRERALAQLFYDTIEAYALQMERTPDELEENNRLAEGYLATLRQNEYVQR